MRPVRHQRGVVLLLLMLAVFMAGSIFYLTTMNNNLQSSAVERQLEVSRQMSLAKEALLAYAANSSLIYGGSATGPGFLPCPDTNNDGAAESSCNSTSMLGRLPEYAEISGKRYSFSSHNAGIDQQFWYAVSPYNMRQTTNYHFYRTGSSYTAQRLRLDGTTNIVAVLIAPGDAFADQDRAAGPTIYTNYLEGSNGTGYFYFSSDTSDPDNFNDQVLAITHRELMHYMGTSAAREIKKRIDVYYTANGNQYPPASTFVSVMNHASVPQWFHTLEYWVYPPFPTFIFTTYTRLDSDTVTVSFYGCTGMQWEIDYTGGITVPEGSVAC